MRKILWMLLAALLFLSGCGKKEALKNPYRLKTQILESDRHGNLIREDCRWEPGNNSSYTLYSYEKDRLLREEYFVGEELESYTEYTYDENGLIQTAIAYKADGTLHDKHVSTFDEYGNTLEVVAFAYASEQARFGKTDEEPDSRTTDVYELKN